MGQAKKLLGVKPYHFLHIYQPLVISIARHQFGMVTSFYYFSFLQNNDLISMANGGKPVCNHNAGAVLHHIINGILHQAFAFCIQ